MALIDELYTAEECEKIKALYSEDVGSRKTLLKSFGQKIIENDNILISTPLDILCLICMTANFAYSETECQTVAIIVHKHLRTLNPLPYILDDHGFLLAEKTLVSLSFFLPAMIHRSKRRGAPSPDFYRKASKLLFSKNEHTEISENHEKWECFLCEMLLT